LGVWLEWRAEDRDGLRLDGAAAALLHRGFDEMDIRYELLPFSEEVRRAYLELLPEQRREIMQGKLEWKFRTLPSASAVIAVARHEEAIVGLNAFVPDIFDIDGAEAVGFQSMDTIVSPAARGKGEFGKLINRFYEGSDGALLYGFPNFASSPAFFGRLGWSPFGPVPMLVRPLRSGILRRIASPIPDVPLPILGRRARTANVIERFDADATRLWSEFAGPVRCAVRRDAAFLNWRISDHPSERYKILRSPEGSIAVYKVLRKHGAMVGYLMEALGSGADLKRLIREVLHRMRDEAADIAFAWCLPHSPNYGAHRGAGFWPFPARLRPILINFGARALGCPKATIEDVASWYISYLDSDTV